MNQDVSMTFMFFFSVSGSHGTDCTGLSPIVMKAEHGTISSHVTDETGCGSARSPWLIQAKAGQTIEISLVDF